MNRLHGVRQKSGEVRIVRTTGGGHLGGAGMSRLARTQISLRRTMPAQVGWEIACSYKGRTLCGAVVVA